MPPGLAGYNDPSSFEKEACVFAALMNPKLAQFLDTAWDRGLDWLLVNGISLCMTIVIMMVALKVSSVLINQIGKAIQSGLPSSKRARAVQRSTTLTQILSSTVKAVILFAGTLMALSEVGINVTPILASAGVVGLAVGFGAQSLVKDVVSGFFILLEDQYGIGDSVTISGHTGVVETMNLRITQLRHEDHSLITIPNGLVAVVSNQSKGEASRAQSQRADSLEPAMGSNS
jgi:small conductance mechanosensitive channel